MANDVMKRTIQVLLPKGSAWAVAVDGELDRFLDAMADCAEETRAIVSSIADMRDPNLTPCLDDLEKEFGVIPDHELTEAERRTHLNATKNARPGTGSEDNLEAMLRAAGFDVYVWQNCPAIDPNSILMGTALARCGNFDSRCGNEGARCGYGGGELIVNGDTVASQYPLINYRCGEASARCGSGATCGNYTTTTRVPYIYIVPENPARWPFVFWIAADRSGWQFLADWNMEKSGVADWTPVSPVHLTKDTTKAVSGIRSMRATANAADTDAQEIQPVDADSDLVDFFRMWDAGAGAVDNRAPLNAIADGNCEKISTTDWTTQDASVYKMLDDPAQGIRSLRLGRANKLVDGFMETISPNVIKDGYCEDSGVAQWAAGASATLTKQTTTPYSGKRCLRIAHGGTDYPYASQTVMTAAKVYRVHGRARSDGTLRPRVYDTGVTLWTGTTSTDWQEFDVVFTATTTMIAFRAADAGAGYIEIDEVTLTDETVGCAAWLTRYAALVVKRRLSGEPSVLRVINTGTTYGQAYQSVMTIGKTYRIIGRARSDGTVLPRAKTTTTWIWTGTTSTDWQAFDVVFRCDGTELRLYAETPAGYTEWDSIELTEVSLLVDTDMETTGPDVIVDGDMEAVGVASWTGTSSTPTKSAVSPHGGTQCLRITRNGTNNIRCKASDTVTAGNTYRVKGWARSDTNTTPFLIDPDMATAIWTGTTSTNWQPFDFVFKATGSNGIYLYTYSPTVGAYVEFDDIEVIDETVACAAWTVYQNGILSKQNDAYEGSQCLRTEYNGTTYYGARQAILTGGKTYRVRGRYRGNGTAAPQIAQYPSGSNIIAGSSSASWQMFDAVFVALHTGIAFRSNGVSSGYVEFDDIKITPVNLYAIQGGSSPVLTIGNDYRFRGWAKGDGTNAPICGDEVTPNQWTGTASTAWQAFDVTFTAAGTKTYFGTVLADIDAAVDVRFDGIMVEDVTSGSPVLETDATAAITANGICALGRAINFNDPAAQVTAAASNKAMSSVEQTMALWYYPIEMGTAREIAGNGSALATNLQVLQQTAGDELLYKCTDGTVIATIQGGTLVAYTLNRIVVARTYDGVATTISLYLNGSLVDSVQFAGPPVVSSTNFYVSNPSVGAVSGLVPMVDTYRGCKSAAWVAADYVSGFEVLTVGPGFEQEVDPPITASTPITAYAWSDNVEAWPELLVQNPTTDEWEMLYFPPPARGASPPTGRIDIDVVAPNGLKAIRMLTKHSAAGWCNWDDISIMDPSFTAAKIPARLRQKFIKMVLKGKPLHSWGGAVIEWT